MLVVKQVIMETLHRFAFPIDEFYNNLKTSEQHLRFPTSLVGYSIRDVKNARSIICVVKHTAG